MTFNEKIDELFSDSEAKLEAISLALEAGEVPSQQASASGMKTATANIAEKAKAMCQALIKKVKEISEYAKNFIKNMMEKSGAHIKLKVSNSSAYIQKYAQRLSELDNNFAPFNITVSPSVTQLKNKRIDYSSAVSVVINKYFEVKLKLFSENNSGELANIEKSYSDALYKEIYSNGKKPDNSKEETVSVTVGDWSQARKIFGNQDTVTEFTKTISTFDKFNDKLNSVMNGNNSKLMAGMSKLSSNSMTAEEKSELDRCKDIARQCVSLNKELMKFSGEITNIMLSIYNYHTKIIKTGVNPNSIELKTENEEEKKV